jgi:hypothetical protein
MEINRGAVGIFLALCIVGGATGFYLATSRSPQPVLENAPSASIPDSAEPLPDRPAAAIVPAPSSPPPAVVERRAAPAPRPAPPARRPQPASTPERPTAPPIQRSTTSPAPNPFPSTTGETRGRTSTTAESGRTFDAAPIEAPEPPAPQFVELVVPAESVIGLQVETALTSEHARVEDEVVARVTRDVRVGERVAIPSGAKAYGQVTLVERGGRLRERARLGIRFTSVVLADGTRIRLDTETIYREGDSPASESSAKIGGGAIGGAIIGGILGGAKGAVIGGSMGAGAGTAAVYAGGRNAATLPGGTPVTIRLTEPASVTVEY